MNSKMMTDAFHVQSENLIRDFFGSILKRFSNRKEDKQDWLKLSDAEVSFFDNGADLEGYMISFRE